MSKQQTEKKENRMGFRFPFKTAAYKYCIYIYLVDSSNTWDTVFYSETSRGFLRSYMGALHKLVTTTFRGLFHEAST